MNARSDLWTFDYAQKKIGYFRCIFPPFFELFFFKKESGGVTPRVGSVRHILRVSPPVANEDMRSAGKNNLIKKNEGKQTYLNSELQSVQKSL